MNIKTIKAELWEIATRFPTLAGLLQKEMPGIDRAAKTKTVGQVWAETIAARNLNSEHFENVCYEYAMAERRMPERLDMLLIELIEEVRNRMRADERRYQAHEIQVMGRRTKGGVMDWVRKDKTGSICVWLGEQVKAGHITREENDRRMDELLAWDKQKAVTEPPKWMAGHDG